MSRCRCAPPPPMQCVPTPPPSCNPPPSGPAPLNYTGERQAPHPYIYWLAHKDIVVEAGKNVEVETRVDDNNHLKTYRVSALTDPEVIERLDGIELDLSGKADRSEMLELFGSIVPVPIGDVQGIVQLEPGDNVDPLPFDSPSFGG